MSIAPGTLVVDGRRIPIDSDGRPSAGNRGPQPHDKSYSAQAVLRVGGADAGRQERQSRSFRAQKRLWLSLRLHRFGTFRPRNPRLCPRPDPGVEINATMLDDLLPPISNVPCPCRHRWRSLRCSEPWRPSPSPPSREPSAMPSSTWSSFPWPPPWDSGPSNTY